MLFIARIYLSSNPSDMPGSDIAIRLTLNYSDRRTWFGSPARSLTSNNTSALGFCLWAQAFCLRDWAVDTIHRLSAFSRRDAAPGLENHPSRPQIAPFVRSSEWLGRQPVQETAYPCGHSIGALFLQKVASIRNAVHWGIGEVTVPPCNGFFIAKG